MQGTRRRARQIALQTLYEINHSSHNPNEIVNRLSIEYNLTQEASEFSWELINGVLQNQKQLDETIHRFAPAWSVDQIPSIDKNVLRLAIFEILLNNKVPVRAAINEAVELAKTFGSESSPRFVNGVLGSISAEFKL